MASTTTESAAPAAAGTTDAAATAHKWAWEGKVASAVPAATADEAWALLSDFLAFHRWHPRVAACRLASGAPRTAGCVRYCEGTADGAAPPDWAHETLLEHDPDRRFFRYEMNDNNMGFARFFATFRVVPCSSAGGCELRWEFECDPVRGTPRDALVARLQAGLDGMAARVRDHVLAARAADAGAGAAAAAGLEAADELKLGNSIAV